MQRQKWQENAKVLVPLLREVVATPFDIIARKRGSHWRLENEQKDSLALAVGVLIEKYLPDFMERYQEEIVLTFVLLGIVAPRMRTDAELQAKAARAKESESVEPSTHGHRDARDGQDNPNDPSTDA